MSGTRPNFISSPTVSLKYTIWPGGSIPLLCFHGFGQDHAAFKSVSEALKGTHTLYSFDLPFHGESTWLAGDKSFLAEDWFKVLQEFFKVVPMERFEVMGYSMGGKYAMITAQLFPDRVSKLHLMAPDGIRTHFSYRYSTLFFPFRKIFKAQIQNPWAFRMLVRLSRTLRIQDSYTLRFAERQMDTEFKRAQVYYTWVALRHFMPDLKAVAAVANSESCELIFYLGDYDKIIHQKEIKPLMKLVPDHTVVHVESGHSKLIEEVSRVLMA